MANIKSAKKRIKTIDKKTARNIRIRGHIKQAQKQFLLAVEEGNVQEAEKAFATYEKKIMQAVVKGPVHKNTASRSVSRMAKRLNDLKAEN